jgi:arylsulfatase A-like enzyme
MRSLFHVLSVVSLLALHTVASAAPNMIIILADDLGRGDLSCYGGEIQPTPNIDRLAKEGIRFAQYYAASTICSPSRAGLLTGMAPARWRITSFLQTRAGNRGCEQVDFLDPQAPALPRHLKSAGYRTAHFGKWHLGGGRDVKNAPKLAEYGYDENVSTFESPEPHPDITAGNWVWSEHDKVKRWERTRFFVDHTLDFLLRHKGQPCFVNLWLDDPHTPWVPGPDAKKGETLENLRQVMAETDRQIGRLLDGLRKLGIDENTLVIFTSDNGPLPTFDASRNAGLRASKLSLYEGGIRMPFLARWPARIPPGSRDEQTVLAALDLFPTLASLAGAGIPEGVAFDGEDMSSALLGRPAAGRKAPLFWEYGRNDRWFRFPGSASDRSPNLAIREGQWKFLINAEGSRPELYDLAADPGEKTNMAETHREIAERLRERLLTWWKALPPPTP